MPVQPRHISAFDGIGSRDAVGDAARSALPFHAWSSAPRSPLDGDRQIFSGGFGFAHGSVLQRGTPIPFASGGIISTPVSFPLAGGRIGLAGERGPEAIMPLTRTADGRLGVATSGSGGPSITINIATPDVESFARSQTQVAALAARALGRASRNT